MNTGGTCEGFPLNLLVYPKRANVKWDACIAIPHTNILFKAETVLSLPKLAHCAPTATPKCSLMLHTTCKGKYGSTFFKYNCVNCYATA